MKTSAIRDGQSADRQTRPPSTVNSERIAGLKPMKVEIYNCYRRRSIQLHNPMAESIYSMNYAIRHISLVHQLKDTAESVANVIPSGRNKDQHRSQAWCRLHC